MRPKGERKIPHPGREHGLVRGLVGAQVGQWADGPGLGMAWCEEAQCTSGPWAQIFFWLDRFHVENNEVFPFLFSKF
jgi:hypothetical protein